MSQGTKKRDKMGQAAQQVTEPSTVDRFLNPDKLRAYRKHQQKLYDDYVEKSKIAKEKEKNGASNEAKRKARQSAKEAEEKAKKAILG